MKKNRKPIILGPGEGREYDMGSIVSIFKADSLESNSKYSISEWWVDSQTEGAHPHKHEEDDIFFVIEGTMSILLNDQWIDAKKGAFVLAPGGTLHGFENRSDKRAGLLNISIPGGFEDEMDQIVDWYKDNPPRKLER